MKVSTVKVPMAEWAVCIPDHHPGYVTWDQYLATQQRLRANSLSIGRGGGAPREGSALLQGLVRCGKCGRKMMVHYSGRNGGLHRYSCARTYLTGGPRRPCQSIGGRRLDSTVVDAFLQAVNPASVQATAGAVDQLQAEHQERVRLGQLAVEQAEFEAGRRQRQFDACEPENRLVARTLETVLEQALAEADHRRRALGDLQRQRPAPLSAAERRSLRRLAGNLGSIWNAHTTTDQDQKQLLRALLDDVVLEVDREHNTGAVELVWQGGERTELAVRLSHSGLKRTSTPVDLIDLIALLARHSNDREIALVLSKQGRQTPTGLPFTAARVAGIRERAGIPAAPPPTTASEGVSINEAADRLGVCTQTIRRWLVEGLLPAEQTTPHAPWRISITDQVRERFVPDVPAGYLKLDEAARQLGVARQTVLNQVRSGHRRAVHVVEGHVTVAGRLLLQAWSGSPVSRARLQSSALRPHEHLGRGSDFRARRPSTVGRVAEADRLPNGSKVRRRVPAASQYPASCEPMQRHASGETRDHALTGAEPCLRTSAITRAIGRADGLRG